jgi:hypothetical protein
VNRIKQILKENNNLKSIIFYCFLNFSNKVYAIYNTNWPSHKKTFISECYYNNIYLWSNDNVVVASFILSFAKLVYFRGMYIIERYVIYKLWAWKILINFNSRYSWNFKLVILSFYNRELVLKLVYIEQRF